MLALMVGGARCRGAGNLDFRCYQGIRWLFSNVSKFLEKSWIALFLEVFEEV